MSSASNYCPSCGHTLAPQASVCPECGTRTGGDPTLALFSAVLAAIIGVFAFAILCGPIAAVTGFYAYQRGVDWRRTLAGVVCVVGIVEALLGAYAVFVVLGGV